MSILDICKNAKRASYTLATLTSEQKNKALFAMADALDSEFAIQKITKANLIDMENAKEAGISSGMLDRLSLENPDRIKAMADGIRSIAKLPDPIGEVLDTIKRPNGLIITKKRVPIGTIGIIYEARPNVTSDAAAITLKTGNSVILKGGSTAIESNKAIVSILREALTAAGIDEDAICLIESTDHESTKQLLKMNGYIDCIIPRGSKRLIDTVIKESSVPVIETGAGNCHIYVASDADVDMAINIINNAKTQRIGVCNAAESLLVDREIAPKLLPRLEEKLSEHHVLLKADEYSYNILKHADKADESDWGMEYLDYIMSVKTVDSIDEAIEHINKYSTKHSECIVTSSDEKAERFLDRIDSACVYVNASTRFTDGGEFGFGAEIGISTQKLHARGPMGLKELTSYKYQIRGNGQVRP